MQMTAEHGVKVQRPHESDRSDLPRTLLTELGVGVDDQCLASTVATHLRQAARQQLSQRFQVGGGRVVAQLQRQAACSSGKLMQIHPLGGHHDDFDVQRVEFFHQLDSVLAIAGGLAA